MQPLQLFFSDMNLRTLKSVVLGLLLAVCPVLHAQSAARDTGSGKDIEDSPRYGVRFVVCTAGAGQLPSPLYVKWGKNYAPITISKMMPSFRVQPERGVVKFYDRVPEKNNKNAKEEKVEPVLTVQVPEQFATPTAKSICILQPRKANDSDPLALFLKESEFKSGGIYIINFTAKPLEMLIDPTGQFDGKERKEKIAPRVNTRTISANDANAWSFRSRSSKPEGMSYILRSAPTAAMPEGRRIRAGVMLTAPSVSQVSIVVDHPRLKDTCSLLSVQFGDDEAIINVARAQQEEAAREQQQNGAANGARNTSPGTQRRTRAR